MREGQGENHTPKPGYKEQVQDRALIPAVPSEQQGAEEVAHRLHHPEAAFKPASRHEILRPSPSFPSLFSHL